MGDDENVTEPKKPTKFEEAGQRLAEQLLRVGIDGLGAFRGAVDVAEQHRRKCEGDTDAAVRRLIATHVRLAAVSGFVTGLGGLVVLPVAVPASVTGLYLIATRMVAGIAHLHGHDVHDEEVRSVILVCLLGSGAATALKAVGIEIGQKSTMAAVRKVPGRVLLAINRRVGYRLVTRAGTTGTINLTKLVPLVGAPIGATVDGVSCQRIAHYARATFGPEQPNPTNERRDQWRGRPMGPWRREQWVERLRAKRSGDENGGQPARPVPVGS